MADKIVIAESRRYEGEYDFDVVDDPLTTLEWRWIKKISGYLPMTFEDGFVGRDPDLFLAFAVIALRRAGKVDKDEALLAAERMEDGARIRYVVDVVDVVADADDQAPAPDPDKSNPGSGEPSSQTSGQPGQTQSDTGDRSSEMSADSVRLTSVI